ncbi:MAG: superoxide dismutase, partial [Pseudonocardia sp.]|nr:superoxide dismutase [Pseudonocardia sp.]
RLDLRTGRGKVISEGPGTPSVGVEVDRGRLFVAGGPTGDARVVDIRTGEVLATYPLGGGFVNDVAVTRDAAWFSDSVRPVIHKLPLGRGGALPDPADAVSVPITGDLVYGEGFNANGIEATPDGRGLLLVQSSTGLLFRADPASGATTTVDLGGELLTNGDGLTLDGRTLYAVQNQLSTLAVIELARDGRSGHVTQRITDPLFDVPTTVARAGGRLYLPNARFGTRRRRPLRTPS